MCFVQPSRFRAIKVDLPAIFCMLFFTYKFYSSYIALHKSIHEYFSLLEEITEDEF